ncbi:hypothetical protein A9D14_18635 (plasmid) [Croceicoccus marinus]|uniref:Uncharacterized protein n=1 Tax=Croceicoccus marinus TaxID=450378 RepID=A0A217EZ00_9SPHN|nr:hypothetical protein A9D14_18635 [Croceicoccus marinus]
MVAALPLKRMSFLRMELRHAFLRYRDELFRCVSMLTVNYNVDRSLHVLDQEDHSLQVDGMAFLGQRQA